MKSNFTHSTKLFTFFLVCFLSFSTVLFAQSATVTTDKSDYAPGETVIVTGTNWQPGETVKLTFTETPLIHPEEYLYATADAAGNIYNNQYVIQNHDVGQLFTLIATGLTSGYSAQTLFTDSITSGIAPVNPPTGGFHIEGNLVANTPTVDKGDWLPGTGGSGGNVLDASGTPLNTSTTFHLTDLYNSTSDDIFGGGDKVDDNPNDWTWVSSTSNDKTDMNNALIHLTTDASGNVWFVFAADRFSNSGNAYMDFEFLQTAMTKTSGGFSTSAPATTGGRTFGDFLLTVYFESGVAKFDIQRWEQVSGVWQYKTYSASLPAGSVYAAGNTASVPVSYGAFGTGTYPSNTFIESAVNLTAVLGAIDPCVSLKIKTIFVKSKTSTSSSAAIKDFFNPLQIDNLILGSADAGDDDTVCSGSPYTLQGSAVASPSYYVFSKTWSVISGAASIADPSNLNSNVTVTSSPATLRLTVVTKPISGIGSTCTVSDDVVITVNNLTPGSIDNAQTICEGDDVAAFTSTTDASGDGTITYQWQSSTTSAVAGFSNIGGATSATFNDGTITQDTWYKRIATSTLLGKA
ncbi:hypothetical protein, partial [Flavobacterium sp. ZB4R12]|uniref:hypothetical protein n=1 Tax=Flavobacterium sp. ZB4R12 TaxID=3398732 RepID=UPI003AAFD1FF